MMTFLEKLLKFWLNFNKLTHVCRHLVKINDNILNIKVVESYNTQFHFVYRFQNIDNMEMTEQ